MELDKILSIPMSLWVSLHFFPFKEAIKLPVLVRYNTKIKSLKGKVVIPEHGGGEKSRLTIGFGNVEIYDKKYQRSVLELDGTIELPEGKTRLGLCSKLSVGKNGVLTFGKNFVNSSGVIIICNDHITIGDNVLVSWETMIMDTDWHKLKDTITGTIHPVQKPIIVGNNVWICCRSTILKGSVVADGCTVAAGAVVSGKYEKTNSILGGIPAKIIKGNITRYANNI